MASTFPVGSLAAPGGSRVASDKKFESFLSNAFIPSFSFSKTPNVALRPTQRSLLISAMGAGLHFNKDGSSVKKLQFKDVNKLADIVGVATFGPKGRNVGAKLVTNAAGDGEVATAKSTKAELEDPVGAKSARQAVAKSKGLARDGMPRRYWNINLEEMMEAGVHFGHGTRKWNPKMAPYISAKRKGIHIINLTKSARFLSEACDLAFDAASKGKQFLIVGTKNKAADLVARAAIKARCHYVNKKWLGGMLTNWYTTETRLHRFRDLRTELKTGRLNRLPKRDAAVLKRQLSHLETYLGGIKYMTAVPDVVIIVDQQEEITALRECITLGIPTICLIDTNCNPDLADMCIPANDDAIASIRLILNKLVFAICEGRSSYVRKS